jgi:hypothetical protein
MSSTILSASAVHLAMYPVILRSCRVRYDPLWPIVRNAFLRYGVFTVHSGNGPRGVHVLFTPDPDDLFVEYSVTVLACSAAVYASEDRYVADRVSHKYLLF